METNEWKEVKRRRFVGGYFYLGGGTFIEGFQTCPACPCGKCGMNVRKYTKMSEWRQ